MIRQTAATATGRRSACSRSVRKALIVLASSAISACSDPATSPEAATASGSFSVLLAVRAAAEAPVPGARVLAGKQLLGTTDGSGLSRLRLPGRDGQTVPLTIECPAGFSSPEAPVPVALRELAPGSRPPRFEAHCAATTHSVLVGIRAEHGANLPILQLDRGVGSTDTAGLAHVLLSNVTPDQPIALTLDTSLQPLLRPQNPVLTFVPAARDEFVLLEQQFSRLEPKRKPKGPRPMGPQRL
jgi:hypothetical protein